MKRKLLLINPAHPERLVRLNLPMGLLYVGTSAARRGYEVNILDANNYESPARFWQRVEDEAAEALAVGLSVMTAQVRSAIAISRRLRQLRPSLPIIWGGIHPTMYPAQVAAAPYVDYAVRREGETTILELLAAIESGVVPEAVDGLAFRADGRVVLTAERAPEDIDLLPPPRWELCESVREVGDMAEVARRTGVGLPILTSRGCPHRCTFCINPVLGIRYRFRRAGLVLDDLQAIVSLGVDRISFFDEDLFANRPRLQQVLDGIRERGLSFRWFASTRVDYFRPERMTPELLARIKESGCQQLGFGAESGSRRVLEALKKDIVPEDTLNAARMLNQAGIDATFSFMVGLPGEEAEDVRQTVGLITRLTAINDSFRILGPFIYRPYPGSELYDRCLKEGMREPQTLEEWAESPYVGSSISPADYALFPWVRYPMEDLTRLIFYSWLTGLRLRWGLLTKLVRAIGALRCRHLFFRWPVERAAVQWLSGLGLDRLLSVGKFG